jgi:hypothetical protein
MGLVYARSDKLNRDRNGRAVRRDSPTGATLASRETGWRERGKYERDREESASDNVNSFDGHAVTQSNTESPKPRHACRHVHIVHTLRLTTIHYGMMSTVVNLHSIRGTLEQPILSESPCGPGSHYDGCALAPPSPVFLLPLDLLPSTRSGHRLENKL